MTTEHRFSCRVYYEDTDAEGIVYYANYLRFIERARTEFLRANGIHHRMLAQEHGAFFVVAKCSMTYISPAYLDDQLEIVTIVDSKTSTRLTFKQDIFRDDQKLFTSLVTLACINASCRASCFPACIGKICKS
ncbi:MAG: tol-pal system-associated acyl-CoA thioesterase [Holosporales bacterium]|jgi:acyl-CoA thioester hydrolase|nr:tol-pal system-associated acyl-CoA thioesterase [Holosporales bacterium]